MFFMMSAVGIKSMNVACVIRFDEKDALSCLLENKRWESSVVFVVVHVSGE